ncbi:MAG: DUF4384 domain-containing protein [Myxococcaceae bacterium]|nr:DUF4384 domain-containing protein [Myxococcaceae bacterium]MCI0669335.1 DUF4384 domain-containing protein [Myxococcaceae bacterium]
MSPEQHVARHTLTRLRAGELTASEETTVSTHLGSCPPCAAKLAELEEEAVRFEVRIPFARFEAGVRAKSARRAPGRKLAWLVPTLSLAAAAVLAVVALPRTDAPGNRLKGGADVTLAIASASGTQRTAQAAGPEALARGDRVRIGYTAGSLRFILAVSVDATGEVTPLYPEAGTSIPAASGPGPHYLPDSLEFTGRGAEAVVVVMSERPLPVERAVVAAREAYRQTGGDVTRLPRLAVEGEQFRRILVKP